MLKLLDIVEAWITQESKNISEFEVYEPQIFGYGIRRPSVAWDFRNTEAKGSSFNSYNNIINKQFDVNII